MIGVRKYHDMRDANPRKFGIIYGSPQHAYSSGFSDAAEGREVKGCPYTFDKNKKERAKVLFAYKMGRFAGRKWRKQANTKYNK